MTGIVVIGVGLFIIAVVMGVIGQSLSTPTEPDKTGPRPLLPVLSPHSPPRIPADRYDDVYPEGRPSTAVDMNAVLGLDFGDSAPVTKKT